MGYGSAALVFSSRFLSSCGIGRSRPNIIFIFSDDHAYQAISAYGGRLAEVAPTPNIDRIANEGMRFDKCCVTNSICAPSRATILTGKHSHLNGVVDNSVEFDGTQQTFPKLLQQSGYQTAIIGKWHLKSDPTGFDFYQVLPGQGSYYNPDFLTSEGQIRVDGYCTDIITDKALEWLKNERDLSKPFMLMVQHKAPHREWSPALRHLTIFDDVEFPEPDNLFDDYEGRGTAANRQDMSVEKTMTLNSDLKVKPEDKDAPYYTRGYYARMNEEQRQTWDAAYDPKTETFKKANLTGKDLLSWKYQRYLQDYLGCIRAVDEGVGRILDYLDETGLAENTVLMYNSDQGFYLGEHGWFDKRFMYEESYRTPLLARWPGVIKPGSINDDLVSNLDFAQTFLDMAKVEQPADMQGLSLVPVMTGKTPRDWRTGLYYHYYEYPAVHSVRRHEGVATKRHKLIHFYDLGEWELYDLEKDPQEMKSEYENPEYADIIAELKLELQRLREVYQLPPLQPDKEKV
ncbi:sulfatase [bacterium]|nr:sulfatase [bacterium]RQV92113.1 MAG: DUF4976 domain-containing protein [bacterium]